MSATTKTLTAANATLFLGIQTVQPIPVQIQGFSTNDMFSFGAVNPIQVEMGVDGNLSAGFVYREKPMTIMLQATSDSNDVFDAWATQQEAGPATYAAFGTISVPSIGRSATLSNGYLTSGLPFVTAQKVLGPRSYTITWGKITVIPLAVS